MNKIPNRQAICEVLMKHAETDKDIVVLCSDSRGSASLTPFANAYPEQFVEMGIAEQDLVSVSAGLAKCGKKAFAASPACFLSTRSYEQAKIDCAYSNTNVKLIGISGGVSYGALGMSHHSAQDIAAMAAIPNMRVYLPSDRFQTAKLVEALLTDEKPAYIRVGRNAVADIYSEENTPFEMDKATVLSEGTDVLLVACGEMVRPAFDAAAMLKEEGISAGLLDMYCVKPLDKEGLVEAAKKANPVLLEPIFKVEVTVPEEYMGDIIGDINSRRGRIEGMDDLGGGKIVRAFVPLSEMFGYSTDLRSRTQGRGNYSMFFDSYEQVPKSVQEKVLSNKNA